MRVKIDVNLQAKFFKENEDEIKTYKEKNDK
jgi:hypothetical protein